jgi:gentisate 1,2-dioxygenase
VLPTHWRKSEIDIRLENIFKRPTTEQTTGRALQLATQAMAPAAQPIPSMNVAINTLEPGENQRPHRHNGVAITLAIEGHGVYSIIEDEHIDWSIGAAQITPATELHSHHNRGAVRMESLVVQDEGLHFYTRTPGFNWA